MNYIFVYVLWTIYFSATLFVCAENNACIELMTIATLSTAWLSRFAASATAWFGIIAGGTSVITASSSANLLPAYLSAAWTVDDAAEPLKMSWPSSMPTVNGTNSSSLTGGGGTINYVSSSAALVMPSSVAMLAIA